MHTRRRATAAFIITGGIILIADMWHILIQWVRNPPDRYFTWIAHYYADYFLYVSQIAQGVRGNWIWSSSMYTNEMTADTWVYWPNVIMGKIGSLLTHSPFIIYISSLILFITTLLMLLYFITKMVFPKQPMTHYMAFLFCITASNFADIPALLTKGVFLLKNEMWFSPAPALNRLGGVPHQTLQTILLLLTILFYTTLMQVTRRSSKRQAVMVILFGIVSFLAATVSPVQMVLVCIAIVAVTLYTHPTIKITTFVTFGLLCAGIGAYVVNRTFDTSILYTTAKAWEATQIQHTRPLEFLLALGPIIFLIPFGIRPFLQSATPLRLMFIIYTVTSLAVFFTPLPALLGTSPTRWIHPASFIGLSLLAAEGWKRIPKKYALIVTLLYLFLTIPAIVAQVEARSTQRSAPVLFSDLNHVPEHAMAALGVLEKRTESGVVLTDPTLPFDLLVPIFSGKTSFTGHPLHTLYPQEKEQTRRRFFSGLLKENEARRLLTDHNIRFILSSAAATRIVPQYPFMTRIFQNETIVLYEINRD